MDQVDFEDARDHFNRTIDSLMDQRDEALSDLRDCERERDAYKALAGKYQTSLAEVAAESKKIVEIYEEYSGWIAENVLAIIVGDHKVGPILSDAILNFDTTTEEWVITGSSDKGSRVEIWRGDEPEKELKAKGWFDPFNPLGSLPGQSV